MTYPVIERLGWRDPEIATIAFPGGAMTLRQGFGSGLAVRPGDPPGHVWAIGDRGPNIKVRDMMRHYGLEQLAPLSDIPGAKIMPWLDVGPALAELRVVGDCVELLRIVPLRRADGHAITGLPNPGSDQLLSEPATFGADVLLPESGRLFSISPTGESRVSGKFVASTGSLLLGGVAGAYRQDLSSEF
jgi:hypothetical protein